MYGTGFTALPATPHLVVQVRTGRATGGADIADDVALVDVLALGHVQPRLVAVTGLKIAGHAQAGRKGRSRRTRPPCRQRHRRWHGSGCQRARTDRRPCARAGRPARDGLRMPKLLVMVRPSSGVREGIEIGPLMPAAARAAAESGDLPTEAARLALPVSSKFCHELNSLRNCSSSRAARALVSALGGAKRCGDVTVGGVGLSRLRGEDQGSCSQDARSDAEPGERMRYDQLATPCYPPLTVAGTACFIGPFSTHADGQFCFEMVGTPRRLMRTSVSRNPLTEQGWAYHSRGRPAERRAESLNGSLSCPPKCWRTNDFP